jgi:hypothetical protein
MIKNFDRIYDFHILRINIAIATKRNITVKRIVKSSVKRRVVGINGKCISYNVTNVGRPK